MEFNKVWGSDKEAFGIIKRDNFIINMVLLIVGNTIVFLCSKKEI